MAVDLELVRHALSVARKGSYASVEFETADLKFSAELGKVPGKRSVPAVAEQPVDELPRTKTVKAPMVGYFGLPDPQLEPGTQIAAEDVIGYITAVGIPTDVQAGVNGVVEEILVSEGDAVEYGQPLLIVRPE